MKIPKFLDDLSVISKLGDNPGADNGLTAEGLKAKFDEAGLKLQTFLNETLIEKINSLFSLDAPPHEGMNMTGPINMNKNKLGGLADPAEDGDAVNLKFANENYRAADWMPTAEEVGARPDNWMPTAEQVGARANTWLPTIAEIGAAPDGFGLGAHVGMTVADANKATKNGWYLVQGGAANAASPYEHPMLVVGYGQTALTQIAFMGNAASSMTYILIRKRYGANWNEWEWLNPVMDVGVEYRTTERWNGVPVYTMLVDAGTTTTDFSAWIGVPGIKGLVRAVPNLDGTICDEWNGNTGVHANNTFYFAITAGTNNDIGIYARCGSGRVGKSLKIQIWYTK